jgi:hypothetical protein
VSFHNPAVPCIHAFGENYGQVRGAARKLLIDSGLRPYFLLKNALGSLAADRLFTGNRVGIPSLHSAKRISGQASRAGRLDPDLSISLMKLSAFFDAEDRKRPSDQLLSKRQKRSVFGLVFAASFNPLNVVLTTEGTCRIYAKMLDTEPGFWGDYTGQLAQKVRIDGCATTVLLLELIHVLLHSSCCRGPQAVLYKGMPWEIKKEFLHFMMVLAGEGHALTVVEIISTDQTATNLIGNLFAFERVVESTVGHRVGKPRRFTLDCGQNVLVAICTWANGESVQEVGSISARAAACSFVCVVCSC